MLQGGSEPLSRLSQNLIAVNSRLSRPCTVMAEGITEVGRTVSEKVMVSDPEFKSRSKPTSSGLVASVVMSVTAMAAWASRATIGLSLVSRMAASSMTMNVLSSTVARSRIALMLSKSNRSVVVQ